MAHARLALVLSLVLGAAAVIAWWGSAPASSERATPRASASVVEPIARGYDVVLSASDRLTSALPGEAVPSTRSASITLDAHVSLRAAHAGSFVLSLDEVRALDATVLDASPYESLDEARAALEGVAIRVELDDDGRVSSVAEPEGAGLGARILSMLALEAPLSERFAGGVERTQHGLARVELERAGDRLSRERTAYVSLDAAPQERSPEVQLASRGAGLVDDASRLLEWDGEETLAWRSDDGARSLDAHVRISLRAAGTASAPIAGADGWTAHAPTQAPEDAASLRRLTLARADGLTAEALVTTIATAGDSGVVPDHARFLWRATAVLALDPEACAALGALFEHPDTTDGARGLIVDLLGQVDTPEAQAALLDVLASPEAAEPATAGRYVTALSFVAHPSSESVSWLGARLDAADSALAPSVALAAGNVARRASGPEAASLRSRLRVRLEQSEDDEARATMVRALGAAEGEDDRELLERESHHTSPRVRVAAIGALGRRADARSRARLRELVRDAGSDVQRSALRVLEGDAGAASAIAAAARDGSLDEASMGDATEVLRANAQLDPAAAAAALRALTERGIRDHATRARAYAALHAIEG